MRTLDMRFIRYLNLFEKITGVGSQHCFMYNNGIVFLVQRQLVAKAIGEEGRNIKKLTEIMERKVKVIPIPSGIAEIERFISSIIHPIKLKGVEVSGKSIILNAGMQNKAILIGRNKARIIEMKNILNECFGVEEIRII